MSPQPAHDSVRLRFRSSQRVRTATPIPGCTSRRGGKTGAPNKTDIRRAQEGGRKYYYLLALMGISRPRLVFTFPFGRCRVSSPLSNVALILSSAMLGGSVNERWKAPKVLSSR